MYIILHISLTVSYYASSKNDKYSISVKWLWFKFYPRPDKPNKIVNKKKKQNKSKNPKQKFQENIYEIEDEFVELSEDELDERIKSLEKELKIQKQGLNQSDEISKEGKKDKKINSDVSKSDQKTKGIKPIKKSKKEKSEGSGLKGKISRVRELWGKYRDYVPMTWKAFRRLLKQIRFYDTEVEITAGKDDAYDAAMQYGRLNALLFHGLGVVSTVFTLYKPKRAEVKCIFDRKVFKYEISGKIKVRPSTALGIGAVFCIEFLYLFLKKRHKAKKHHKLKRKLMLNNKELLANEG